MNMMVSFSLLFFHLSLTISITKLCEKTNKQTNKTSPDLKAPFIPEDQSFVQNLRTVTSAVEGIQRY